MTRKDNTGGGYTGTGSTGTGCRYKGIRYNRRCSGRISRGRSIGCGGDSSGSSGRGRF